MTPPNPIANMAGLKTAIVNGETKRVKQLLGDQSLDELQKSYLIELAELSNNSDIIALLTDTPEK